MWVLCVHKGNATVYMVEKEAMSNEWALWTQQKLHSRGFIRKTNTLVNSAKWFIKKN